MITVKVKTVNIRDYECADCEATRQDSKGEVRGTKFEKT